MHGEDDHLVDEVQAVDDLAESRLLDVRLAVDRGDDVRARLVRDRERGARDGTEEPARVGHHVADDVEAAEHALVLQRPLRAVVGAEQEPRDPVDFDARVLLGHGEVAAAKTGLDVRDRNRRVRGRPCSCQRRVRVAVHEDDVGLLARDPCRDLRLHPIHVGRVQVEPVARLREPELVEEDLRHDVEPVLPVCRTTSSKPASRIAADSGAALMNCGRLPTTVKTFTGRATLLAHRGRSAARRAPGARPLAASATLAAPVGEAYGRPEREIDEPRPPRRLGEATPSCARRARAVRRRSGAPSARSAESSRRHGETRDRRGRAGGPETPPSPSQSVACT